MQVGSTFVQVGILLALTLAGIKSASIRSARVRRAISSKPILVGYWGQNGAGPTVGQNKYERPLKWFCENSKYDIINLAFLLTFFDPRNKDSLPGLNFAFHCGGGVTPLHPYLFRCPRIEEGIKSCQKNKKQVLLSLGGATGNAVLGSTENAAKLANNLWQLFLGGNNTNMRNLRPFGTAILDGIDLNIEKGTHHYFPDLIKELRRLMATDSSKSYLLTSAPQCPHPDRLLGPQVPGTALEDAGELTDYVFIQFYNNPCWTGAGQGRFDASLEKWLSFSRRKNVGVLIGLPAHIKASGQARYHRTVSDVKVLYDKIRSKVGVRGVMLWDCSWDQNNLVNGKLYSDHIREIIDDTPTTPPTTTTTSQTGTTTFSKITTLPDTTTLPDITTRPDTTTLPDITTESETTTLPDITTRPDTTTLPDITTESETTTLPDITTRPDTTNPTGTTIRPDASTTQPPITGTTNGPTTPAFTCKGKRWGIHGRDPSDCTKFIVCAPGEMMIVQKCPSGLRFNPRFHVCDWPRNVPC